MAYFNDDDSQLEKSRVVIVGLGGYGLTLLKALRKRAAAHDFDVFAVEPNTHYCHILAAPRAIADTEFAQKIFTPYKTWDGVQFVHEKVDFVDSEQRRVRLQPSGCWLRYTVLVCSVGSTNSAFGNSPNTSSEELKTRFENTSAVLKEKNHIVVVGGGLVGLESIGELSEIFPNKAAIGIVALMRAKMFHDILKRRLI